MSSGTGACSVAKKPDLIWGDMNTLNEAIDRLYVATNTMADIVREPCPSGASTDDAAKMPPMNNALEHLREKIRAATGRVQNITALVEQIQRELAPLERRDNV